MIFLPKKAKLQKEKGLITMVGGERRRGTIRLRDLLHHDGDQGKGSCGNHEMPKGQKWKEKMVMCDSGDNDENSDDELFGLQHNLS